LIEGNATFTIAMSRTTMNWTTLSSASASHLRRSEVTMSSVSFPLGSYGLQRSSVNFYFARNFFSTASERATLSTNEEAL
jgi:hypothetical protein